MCNYHKLAVAVGAAVAVMDDSEFASITPDSVRGLAENMRRVFAVSDQVVDLVVSSVIANLIAPWEGEI